MHDNHYSAYINHILFAVQKLSSSGKTFNMSI